VRVKQVLQNLANGDTMLVEAPAPASTPGALIIATTRSLVSAGTERMLVSFGRGGLLEKVRQQPEKVQMVLEKVRTDGLLSTVKAVQSKLQVPIPLGYCNVGVVRSVGSGVRGFVEGDRVVSNGSHADVVRVPQNLCSKVPDGVSDDAAAFVVVASIGLQGVRLAQPTLGECFVVTGVGLIGLLTVQILRANGCRVLAIDVDDHKLDLARQFGAETFNASGEGDSVAAGMAFSRGRGVDGVLIAASSKSSDIVAEAAKMCRKRGRIVLIGVAGLELNRADFYEKELTFQVSCSYGPGRHDPSYEESGHDYPLGFVRWTEQRNFEAILDMLASGTLDVEPLISHRFRFEEAAKAYQALVEERTVLGLLLEYSSAVQARLISSVRLDSRANLDPRRPVLGFVGAGNYASRVLIPAFKLASAQLHTIVTSGGVSGSVHGRKAGFQYAATDIEAILGNPEINTVVIATRHDVHAELTARALLAGKHVFVEKPLSIDGLGLDEVRHAYAAQKHANQQAQLMVGFNRRFAPQIKKMRSLMSRVADPKTLIITVNAGAIPASHWTQDAKIGGGRIIGEACHFIDIARHLVNSPIVAVAARSVGKNAGQQIPDDKTSMTLSFEDGSFATILYLANGASSFPKERIEVFSGGGILQLDNFRKLRGYGWPGFRAMNLWRQDKGQNACVQEFLAAIKAGTSAIPSSELFEVAKATLDIAETIRCQ
jgi:predicted dehydrogenase/threonine dehydrogenase-like Zn-dependent dehydrogenase